MNIRGLLTESSISKAEYLGDHAKDNKVVLMNIMETWLNDTITENAEIKGYKVYRGDRKGRKCGGTAIYLYDRLEANVICEISYEKCEMIAINIPEIQTVNIVIYRPPKTKLKEFEEILNKVNEIFEKLEKPDPTIILSGDFNFPFVKWKKWPNNGCSWEYKSNANATIDEKQQFEKLMKICNNQCLLQTIEEHTREDNTLDLIFTNETSLFTLIEVTETDLSDHNMIEISTNYNIYEQPQIEEIDNQNSILRSLNFHTKKIKWKEINNNIEIIDWKQNLENKNILEGITDLEEKMTSMCIENMPKKSQKRKNRIPKERKKMMNRIKMLKRDKHRAYSKEKKRKIDSEIKETERKILESKKREKLESEKKAIECMTENPRMLYSYINKQRNRQKEIGPFKKDNKLIYDGKEICSSLKRTYDSFFSEKSNDENEELFNDSDEDDLCDIEFDEKDIENAIEDLEENSTAGPDGLPAIFLKKTKKNNIKTSGNIAQKESGRRKDTRNS